MAEAPDPQSAYAQTRHGMVRGLRANGVRKFLGVPYAAPPVGELRFRAPEPPSSWDGVRDATQPGPSAPQFHREFPNLEVTPLIGTGWARGDDFLTVNVWCPDDDASGRPVMVFIHGGAWVLGSKDAAVNDGTAFARSGVVCININYRLGVEGFVPIDGVPTNLGLRDMLFALRWVQENAAAFGGDAGNVTVFGESAGGMSIANLVASPLAKGLFRRAIIQSGHGDMLRPIEVAQRLTHALAKFMEVTPNRDGFASRSMGKGVSVLMHAQKPTTRIDLRTADGREPTFGLSRFVPVYGDDVLPVHTREALKQGAGAEVEVLIGTNREEMNLYFVPTKIRHWMFRPLAGYLVRKSEPQARTALRAYGMGRGRKTGDAFTECLHDLVFRLPARRWAEAFQGRAHFYELEWPSPACEGKLGACHGLELPFVFDTLATTTGTMGLTGPNPPQALADRIHGLWVQFARNGELPWAPFDPAGRQVYQLARGEALREAELPAASIVP